MPRRNFTSSRREPRQRRQPAPKRGRKPVLLIFVLALAALIWFAPTIVVNSPLKNRIIASATSDFQGTITIDSISAGWLSKLRANNIVATDPQGERLVEVTSVELDKTLVSLISDQSDLGTIRIQQPIVNLIVRPDGSNLEDAIAAWLVPSETEQPSNIQCSVEIEDGLIQVTDAGSGASWTATTVGASVALPSDATIPLTAHLDAKINPPAGTPGDISANVAWQPSGSSIGKGKLAVKTKGLPLEVTSAGLQRLAPGASVAGIVDTSVDLNWSDTSTTARIDELRAAGLSIVAPNVLGSDRIALNQLNVNGEIEQRGGAWQIKNVAFVSDVAQLNANGAANVASNAEAPITTTLLEALRYGQFQVDGKVDLARIARMLPATLKIREGTHVATGDITLALSSGADVNGQRWDGRIEAKNLSAMHQGRRLTWDQPIVLSGAAREQAGTIVFDKLSCESSFLNVIGSGTSQQGAANLSGDLSRFATELSQFVDLGDVRLGGQLEGKVNWLATQDQRINVQGTANARNFELVSTNRPPWREELLNIHFSGVGSIANESGRSIDQCELRVQSGQDQLFAKLLPTRAGTVGKATMPISVQLTGELRNWMTRMQPVFSLPGWNIDGTADIDLRANIEDEIVHIESGTAQFGHLKVSNGSVFINEPVVKIETKGTYNRLSSAFTSPDTTIASTSVSLRATQIDVRTTEAIQLAGVVDYRGDVNRISNLFSDPTQPTARRLSGDAIGRAVLQHSGSVTTCEWTSDITQFDYAVPKATGSESVVTVSQSNADPWNSVWREPMLKLAATVAYDSDKGFVDLSRLEAAGDTVSFAARGNVSELTSRCLTKLDGQVAYDLQKLSSRFRQQLGEDFHIAGRDTRPFTFSGPLFAKQSQATNKELTPVSTNGTANANPSIESALLQMIAQASLGWSSASVQGVTIGAGEIDARLSDGKLVVAPFDLTVSEGTVHLAPTLLLDREPMTVTLPAGPVAERVRISPQMCGSWLKYLAPLVADATAAEGNFSIALNQATIPVDAPLAGNIEGVLDVHNAQIGPGPLSQQLLALAAQIKAIADGNLLGAAAPTNNRWLDLPAQRIAFRVAENRVYHDGLQMTVDNVVIRTSGSVGTDQTISMVAEVPVRDEWIAKSKYLAPLRGETIRVPIHGSLTSPRLDQSALTQITQQTVTGAANRYIEGGVNRLQGELDKQLNRGLQSLFGTPR